MSGETKAPINTKSKKGVARVHPPLRNIRPLSPSEHVKLALLRSLGEALPQCLDHIQSEIRTVEQVANDRCCQLELIAAAEFEANAAHLKVYIDGYTKASRSFVMVDENYVGSHSIARSARKFN